MTTATTGHINKSYQDGHQYNTFEEHKDSLATAIAVHCVVLLILANLLLISVIPISVVTVVIIHKINMDQLFI